MQLIQKFKMVISKTDHSEYVPNFEHRQDFTSHPTEGDILVALGRLDQNLPQWAGFDTSVEITPYYSVLYPSPENV